MRILIIDDETFFASNLANYLQKSLEVQCQVASDSNSALKCLQAAPVDLIISDLNLETSLAGDHLLEIEQNFPGQQIIIISSASHLAHEFKQKHMNVRAFFEKPFEVQELKKFIQQNILTTTHTTTQSNLQGEIYDA